MKIIKRMDKAKEAHGDTVIVACRIRPLNEAEIAADSTVPWVFSSKAIRTQSSSSGKTWTYDRVFDPSATNRDLYDTVGVSLVDRVMDGYNGTIFSYGQTGSGKTFSMLGTRHDDGVLPLSIKRVFNRVAAQAGKIQYTIHCSYLEVYNEMINDLLTPPEAGFWEFEYDHNHWVAYSDEISTILDKAYLAGKEKVEIRNKSDDDVNVYSVSLKDMVEVPTSRRGYSKKVRRCDAGKNLDIIADLNERGTIIGGLKEVLVVDENDALQLLSLGESNRKYGHTNMNVRSSRSHTLFRMTVETISLIEEADYDDTNEWLTLEGDEIKNMGGKKHENSRISYLNLVDLAGSERHDKSGTSGTTLKEGASINKSLLTLNAVISALSKSSGTKDIHVPYRDSKLTRILKQSLGGNSFTVVILAISPASVHTEETTSTLNFGSACKRISNKVIRNDVKDPAVLLKQYKKQIEMLQTQLEMKDMEGSYSHKSEDNLLTIESLEDKSREEQAAALAKEIQIKDEEATKLKKRLQVLEGLVSPTFKAEEVVALSKEEAMRRRSLIVTKNDAESTFSQLRRRNSLRISIPRSKPSSRSGTPDMPPSDSNRIYSDSLDVQGPDTDDEGLDDFYDVSTSEEDQASDKLGPTSSTTSTKSRRRSSYAKALKSVSVDRTSTGLDSALFSISKVVNGEGVVMEREGNGGGPLASEISKNPSYEAYIQIEALNVTIRDLSEKLTSVQRELSDTCILLKEKTEDISLKTEQIQVLVKKCTEAERTFNDQSGVVQTLTDANNSLRELNENLTFELSKEVEMREKSQTLLEFQFSHNRSLHNSLQVHNSIKEHSSTLSRSEAPPRDVNDHNPMSAKTLLVLEKLDKNHDVVRELTERNQKLSTINQSLKERVDRLQTEHSNEVELRKRLQSLVETQTNEMEVLQAKLHEVDGLYRNGQRLYMQQEVKLFELGNQFQSERAAANEKEVWLNVQLAELNILLDRIRSSESEARLQLLTRKEEDRMAGQDKRDVGDIFMEENEKANVALQANLQAQFEYHKVKEMELKAMEESINFKQQLLDKKETLLEDRYTKMDSMENTTTDAIKYLTDKYSSRIVELENTLRISQDNEELNESKIKDLMSRVEKLTSALNRLSSNKKTESNSELLLKSILYEEAKTKTLHRSPPRRHSFKKGREIEREELLAKRELFSSRSQSASRFSRSVSPSAGNQHWGKSPKRFADTASAAESKSNSSSPQKQIVIKKAVIKAPQKVYDPAAIDNLSAPTISAGMKRHSYLVGKSDLAKKMRVESGVVEEEVKKAHTSPTQKVTEKSRMLKTTLVMSSKSGSTDSPSKITIKKSAPSPAPSSTARSTPAAKYSSTAPKTITLSLSSRDKEVKSPSPYDTITVPDFVLIEQPFDV